MAAYVLNSDGNAVSIPLVRCKNEEAELQDILEKNPDLIPGDQINPGNPRRWFPIAREMPVPDPATGADRWSIDLVFGDQNAIPTFIEVKRFADTRSRREVVGQMFDYAANGHYYWDSSSLKGAAEKLSVKLGGSLEKAMEGLNPDDDLGVDEYFNRMVENLREGQIRLVFFLEKAPMELKSIVDFLNKQMERTEVLLVEAQQYDVEGKRVVIPSLFGYTEEARQAKRTVTITNGTRRKWNKESFFTDIRTQFNESEVSAMMRLYDICESFSDSITWGTGKIVGSFNPQVRGICDYGFISVKSSGKIELNFGWLDEINRGVPFRDDLKELVVEMFDFKLPDDWMKKYPKLDPNDWIPKADVFMEALKALVDKHKSVAS